MMHTKFKCFQHCWTCRRKATISVFKGKPMVSIREFYEKDGEQKPGNKGISLPPEQWHKLVAGFGQLDAALKAHTSWVIGCVTCVDKTWSNARNMQTEASCLLIMAEESIIASWLGWCVAVLQQVYCSPHYANSFQRFCLLHQSSFCSSAVSRGS